MNSAMSEVDEMMVSVTLLTGAEAATEGVATLIVDGRVVSADDDDDEDGVDIEGGPAPAAVLRDGESCCGDAEEIVVEGTSAGMDMLGTGAEGGSSE